MMKRKLLILLLLIPIFSFGQQVTTSPTIPVVTGEIIIYFDATGTPLENYAGIIYTHTGATVNGTRWQNVIGTWGNNSTQPALTNTSGNTYEFTITPDVFTFYGIDGADTITELSFVFRSADGNTKNGDDQFIDVYEAGLNVVMTNPLDGDAINLNDMVNLSAESSINADLELFVNNISQQTATNTTTISKLFTFTTSGNKTIKVEATQGGSTVSDEISVFIKSPTQNAPLPAGVSSGYNDNGDGTVTFVLLAPNKTDVFLIGGFNNWVLDGNYQMKKDGDYFWVTVAGLNPDTEYAYQYYIDFEVLIADPYALKILDPDNDQYIPDSTYPNLMPYPTGLTTGFVSTFKINDSSYNWQNTSFIKPDKKNLVIYEMLIRDYTETSTYQEAMTHLDYLETLGVTAIALMPINEFGGNISWGYDPTFYMALDKAYGTKNDLKEFVDECHQRGISVIADVVFNHSNTQSPLYEMYDVNSNPFYNATSNFVDNPTPGSWGPDFNHESTYTVNFFNDVVDFWMDEYKIDGFRFDFTKGFSNTLYYGASNWGSAYDAPRIANLKAYADHVWAHDAGNEPYVVFEHLSDNNEETELANYGVMLWGNMNAQFNQNTMGYSDNSDVTWLSYQDRGWNNPHIVGYMESHDEERLMVKNLAYGNSNGSYNIKDLATALERQEAASVIFYSFPGPKMIWQFGELGYDVSINCADDIEDESCRLDPKPNAWQMGYDIEGLNPERAALREVTTTMISLKKQFSSTFNTNNYDLDVTGLVKRINLYDNAGDLDVVILANFDVTTQSVNPNFPSTGIWYETFSDTSINVTNPTSALNLAAGEYRLYTQTDALIVPKVDISKNIQIYPNPASNSFSLSRSATKIELFDITGRRLRVIAEETTSNTPIYIDNLSNGIYFVRIETEEGIGTKRLFKN